jgi:membrane-associated protease RseP (regulator of RpoE activity)
MINRQHVGWMAVTALLAGTAGWVRAGQEEEQPKQAREIVIRTVTEGETKLPEYWLGVGGEAADEALQAQLGLDGGLVVRDVVENSPAAKAGLKKHDIILQLGEKPIRSLPELIQAMRDTNGAETTVVFLRGGKKESAQVSPEKRPMDDVAARIVKVHPRIEGFRTEIDQLVEKLRSGEAEGLRLLTVRPGVELGGTHVFRMENFPDNTQVTVRKDGDGPAKVEITREGKTWKVTEETLEELPEELRGPVKEMLKNSHKFHLEKAKPSAVDAAREGAHQFRLQLSGEGQPLVVRPLRAHVEAVATARGDDEVHKKLDALLKAVQKIEQDLQELKPKE